MSDLQTVSRVLVAPFDAGDTRHCERPIGSDRSSPRCSTIEDRGSPGREVSIEFLGNYRGDDFVPFIGS